MKEERLKEEDSWKNHQHISNMKNLHEKSGVILKLLQPN
jgi:hypothetical protein